MQAREQANAVTVLDNIYEYLIQIMQSLRHHRDMQVYASQRGALSVINAAKIHATLMDRDYVNPDDIQAVLAPCLNHRLQLNSDAMINGVQINDVIAAIIQQTELPQNAPDQN
jgi:MoxR-like ATPase